VALVPGERDVLIMRHDVGVEWPNHNEEMLHVNFVIYGDPAKYSAMAATVGYPTAIAAKMVLEGTYPYTQGRFYAKIFVGRPSPSLPSPPLTSRPQIRLC